MIYSFFRIAAALALLAIAVPALQAQGPGEAQIIRMLQQEQPYHSVSPELFEQLGWDLPDGGSRVKALADAAPGGAVDPRKLESLPADQLGYRAKWHEIRYKLYGLDWDIPGLHLIPNHPLPGMPTLVIIHGGSANWYEFFLDPLNRPGLGQYLAQKIPVLLVTIRATTSMEDGRRPNTRTEFPAIYWTATSRQKNGRFAMRSIPSGW